MAGERKLLRALKGTFDKVPPESRSRAEVISLAMATFARAGYQPIETPILEHTEVFARGVGQDSEVVAKQMYTFTDRGGRSLTLRPEGTAGVMRAVLEHSLARGSLPIKVAYAGAMFRQERPQKGRHRELFQLGIEAIGAEAPLTDAEVIEVGARFIAAAGASQTLTLNSIGHVDSSCRLGYVSVLAAYIERKEGELAEEDRARARVNPLRLFDSKDESTRAVMAGAPLIDEHLCGPCREHFESVQRYLTDAGVPFKLDARLVRGLDYYTRTAWEYIGSGLGSQDTIGGGGRYDGLAEALGGARLPGVGFALGLDRLMLVREAPETGPTTDVYIVALGEAAAAAAWKLAVELRRADLGAELDHSSRSMKGQMKDASRSGARWAVILGEEEMARGEAALKDLTAGDQHSIPLAEVTRRVTEMKKRRESARR